jgi:hypothetical protein
MLMLMLITLLAITVCSSCSNIPLSINKVTRIDVSANTNLFKIECCSFHSISMKTANGGAIHFHVHITQSTSNPDLLINTCCFIRCGAKSGGAIWFSGRLFDIINSIANHCIAFNVGGFVFIENTDGGLTRVTTTSSSFTSMGSAYLQSNVDHHLKDVNSSSNVGGISFHVHQHFALLISFSRFDSNSGRSCLSIGENRNRNSDSDSIWCSVLANNTCGGALIRMMSRSVIKFTTFVNNTFDDLIKFGGFGSLVMWNCYFDDLSIVASLMMIISSRHLGRDVTCPVHWPSHSPHNHLGRPYIEAVRINGPVRGTTTINIAASLTSTPVTTISASGADSLWQSGTFAFSQFGDRTATYGSSSAFRGSLTFGSPSPFKSSEVFSLSSPLTASAPAPALASASASVFRASAEFAASATQMTASHSITLDRPTISLPDSDSDHFDTSDCMAGSRAMAKDRIGLAAVLLSVIGAILLLLIILLMVIRCLRDDPETYAPPTAETQSSDDIPLESDHSYVYSFLAPNSDKATTHLPGSHEDVFRFDQPESPVLTTPPTGASD